MQKRELLPIGVTDIAKLETHQLRLGAAIKRVEAWSQIYGNGNFSRQKVTYGNAGRVKTTITSSKYLERLLTYALGAKRIGTRLLKRNSRIGNTKHKRLKTRRARLMPHIKMNIGVLA